MESNEMQVIKEQGNFSIIKVADGKFCVRKKFKSFFGKEKQTFIVLNRIGRSFEYDSLSDYVTISDLETCEYVFNCNVLMSGGI